MAHCGKLLSRPSEKLGGKGVWCTSGTLGLNQQAAERLSCRIVTLQGLRGLVIKVGQSGAELTREASEAAGLQVQLYRDY